MTLEAGIVCGACDWLNQIDRSTCEDCGNALNLSQEASRQESVERDTEDRIPESYEKSGVTPPEAASQEAEEKPMEQARHFVCRSCYSPVPAGHKFCGKCGTATENPAGQTPEFFGEMQTPGKAKLILIKGEGMDGISYHLNSTEHLAGRMEGAILFTEDKWLSPKHANFFYRDDRLEVRDEGSCNGVYVCFRKEASIKDGSMFLAGEQVFKVERVSEYIDDPADDGTYFFASPRREPSFRIIQILEGGGHGMVVHAKNNKVEIGREGGDMNFPNDPYISSRHLRVEMAGSALKLVDLGSKNGTYLKISGEKALTHGDYLFIGKQLLRVEITD